MSDEVEVNSRIDRIEVTLDHVVTAIEKMSEVLNKPHETKWGPILTAVSILFMVAAGYTTVITSAQQREFDAHQDIVHEQQEYIMEMQRDIGRLEGRLGISIDE